MGNLLNHLHVFLLKFKWISLFILLFIVSLSIFSISSLNFVEDISRILPHQKNTDKLNYVLKESTLMNKVIFDIHIKNDEVNPDLLVQYADSLTVFLEKDSVKSYFKSLQLSVDDSKMFDIIDVVNNNLPLFLDDKDYHIINDKIDSLAITKTVDAGYKSMLSPISFVSTKYFLEDPFGISFIGINKIKSFNLSDNFSLYKSRVVNSTKTDLLLFANLYKTNTPEQNEIIISEINKYIDFLNVKEFKQVEVEVFGGAIVANENAQRVKKDVTLTVIITLILLVLLIAYFFRRRRAIFVIFIPTILGSIVALGVFAVFNTQISVISLAIGAILLGMSIDFSLHVYSHFREYHSISKMFTEVSTPIALSTSTTVVAFLALKLVNSDVLNDLGVFASLSIFFSALFALTILPILIAIKSDKTTVNKTFLDKLSNYEAHSNNKLMLVVFAITFIFYFVGEPVQFDSDMMHSNYMSDKTKNAEARVNSIVQKSTNDLYVISMSDSLDNVLEQNIELNIILDSLKSVGLIHDFSTVNKLVNSKIVQEQKLLKWNDFWKNNFENTYKIVESEAVKIGFKKGSFSKFGNQVNKKYTYLSSDDSELLSNLILNDFIIKSDSLQATVTLLKVDEAKQVKSIIDAKINNDDIWVYNSQLFISTLIDKLNDSMSNLVYYSLFFVFIILLLYYGRIELTLITMIPIVFGYIWTIGFMYFLGIQFNIFNIIVLSFIFGLGIDYGIFITKGILHKYTHNIDVINEYKSSILLSFFTTIIAVGTLILAQHPAMKSIAIMAIIGISSTLIVTFTIQPMVLNFMLYNKGKKREKPLTLIDFIFSVLSLIYFVSGAVTLTSLSFIFKAIPFGTKAKKTIFHKLLQYFSWWMMYANFFIKKLIINPDKEDFSKPAVIISNHQSPVDVMLMLLLHPKLLILTNDREWNNKLYGHVLKYADFLPVTLPHEELLEKLKEKVELGYSIVVFPEGTRSRDGKMKKFQRGAFLLARELKLDLLPIIFHGNGSILSKDEYTVRRGQMTTKFLPRIDISTGEYGTSLVKQSRSIFKILNIEYEKLILEIETPKYFRSRLVLSYIFRSPILEWYMRIKTKMEDNYVYFDNLIPRYATVSDLGCGYGFLAYTLAQTSKDRKFIGVDFDSEKITIANNSSLINDSIKFIQADLTTYEVEKSDVVLINDVLHYIKKEDRRLVVINAFNRLNANGFMVIRDGDRDMPKKHKVTKLSEIMSTFIKFNKANYKDLDFLSRKEVIGLAEEVGAKLEIVDNTQFTSNIIYILRS